MLRARSRYLWLTRRKPSKKAEVTGKKITSTAIATLAHAKAQPQHQQRGEGKDRDRLTGEHQRHQPALQTGRDHAQRRDAERHAQRRAAGSH